MNFLIIVVVAIAVIAIVLAVLRMKLAVLADQAAVAKPEAYYLRDSLFSPAERSFFGVLETLRPAGVTITCKVRLADIFGPKKGLEPDDRQRALNRISAKHVDFLLIQKSDGRPLLGIELDDCSYEEEARVARDAFVDQVFSAAGLPLLHFTARSAYDPKEVRRQVDEALAKTGPDAVVS